MRSGEGEGGRGLGDIGESRTGVEAGATSCSKEPGTREGARGRGRGGDAAGDATCGGEAAAINGEGDSRSQSITNTDPGGVGGDRRTHEEGPEGPGALETSRTPGIGPFARPRGGPTFCDKILRLGLGFVPKLQIFFLLAHSLHRTLPASTRHSILSVCRQRSHCKRRGQQRQPGPSYQATYPVTDPVDFV